MWLHKCEGNIISKPDKFYDSLRADQPQQKKMMIIGTPK